MKPGVAAALQAGLQHEQQGQWLRARAAYEKALRRDPRSPETLHCMALLEERTGTLDRAVQLYRRAIAARPDYSDAIVNLGIALHQAGQARAALEQFSRALALNPGDATALANRGAVLAALRRPQEALADLDRVPASSAGHLDAVANRGVVLLQLQRPGDALPCFDQVLASRPGRAAAHANRGLALHALRRTADALSSFQQALRLQPGFRAAETGAGECQLLLGDMPGGWPSHAAGTRHASPLPGVPRWTGADPIAGGRLLLYAEQGLGDTLQFCRYAALAAARGAEVVLQVQPPLLPLLATLAGPHHLVAAGTPVPACTLQCALPHAPAAFGTTLDSVPGDTPYLSADPSRVRAWSDRLGPRTRPRIGLAWSGNPDHLNDYNRSMPFAALAPLLEANAEFFSLQREVRPADAGALAASGVCHLGDALHDFADTAALAELMDVVITVDTAIAHLAGALARPVWLLLPWVAEWRWMLDRDDTPWYPTMRLFRQPALADWPGAVQQARAALERLLSPS